ncbi:MAG: AEC family transporter [Acetivibrionales bacterium]|jgi:predicted permease
MQQMYIGGHDTMQYFILSFKVVFPLCFMMVFGYLVRKLDLIKESGFKMFSRTTFHIFLPVLLFVNVYKSDLANTLNIRLIAYAIISSLLLFAILCVLIPRLIKDRPDQPVVIQGIYRSNFIIFGTSIVKAIYPDADLGMVALLAAFAVPLFNALSVLVFNMFSEDEQDLKTRFINVLKNPLIVAGALGLLFLLMKIEIPGLIFTQVENIADLATPIALICLGGTFRIQALKTHTKPLLLTCIGKLILVPFFLVFIAVLLGIRGIELAAIMALFASPVATSTFPMAQELGGNAELAGEIVVLTSIFSIATVFGWVLILSYSGLI